MDTSNAFPDDSIDPRKKDYAWILQYVKAAYHRSKTYCGDTLYFDRVKMQEVRDYARGEQSINKYKKQLNIDDLTDESWANIDFTIPDFLSKFRNIAVAKLCQQSFNTQCFAVDALSRSEEDNYFNQMKLRIMMREVAQQAGSELADSPVLNGNPNEPQNMEELQIEMQYGYKHVLSMEAEEGIELIKQQNEIFEKRKRTVENLVDHGLGGYITNIDENGQVVLEEVVPEELVLSPCNKNDFSDLQYWGLVKQVSVTDLVPYFNAAQIKKISEGVAGKQGNPMVTNYNSNNYYDNLKVYVLQGKFISYNRLAHEERIDKNDNTFFGRTKPMSIVRDEEGEANPVYIESNIKVTYKFKWIIGTDMMYDYGLSENMVRKPSSWWNTDLDIQLYAWSFDKMKFAGLTKKLIPLEDRACLLWFKLQNLANTLIPYLINIDMNVIENSGFGRGGTKWKPSEVVDFIFSKFIVPYRSNDLLNKNPNYKPVSIEQTGQLGIFERYYNDLQNTIEMMRQVSGLNEYTDGSTINAKNSNATNDGMEMSTNNALYLIHVADQHLIKKLSESIIGKIQIAVKLGKVEGYMRALGMETVKFLSINPDISLREFGIFVEPSPTQQQREMLWQEVNMKESQGLLDITDKELIMSARNLKKAMMVLGYRIKKRKEEMQQFELQKIQEANQGQQQMIQMQAQLNQQTIQMQLEADIVRIQTTSQWTYEIEKMKKTYDLQGEVVQSDARNIGHEIQGQAKLIASQIAAGAAIEKQELANKKPMPKKKTA